MHSIHSVCFGSENVLTPSKSFTIYKVDTCFIAFSHNVWKTMHKIAIYLASIPVSSFPQFLHTVAQFIPHTSPLFHLGASNLSIRNSSRAVETEAVGRKLIQNENSRRREMSAMWSASSPSCQCCFSCRGHFVVMKRLCTTRTRCTSERARETTISVLLHHRDSLSLKRK